MVAFFVIRMCLDDCTYQVSSPCKVFNLVAMVNMSEKTPLDLWGVYNPFEMERKPLSNYLKNKTFYP